MALLDDMVAKHGGEDEAYKTKLKENIRGAFGYSNYVNKANEAAGKPLALNLKGKITPSGVKSLVGGAMDMKQSSRDAYGNLAGAIDAQAGTLASAQVAREKAAAAKAKAAQGLENGVAFNPIDPLGNDILNYMQNPTNPDGSTKSLQQLEAELNSKFGMTDGISPEQVKAKLEERVPQDFMGNEDKYHYMAQGYSEKQSEGLQGGLNYAQMSDERKLIYSVRNPAMAKQLEEGSVNKDLIQDLGSITDKDGNTAPKFTFEQMKNKYPNVSAAELKELVKPAERKSVEDDISKWYQGDIKEEFDKIMADKGFNFLTGEEPYKDFYNELALQYSDMFNPKEVELMIYKTISGGGTF